MIVKLEQVEKNYKSFHLRCSLEIQPGTVVGLLGANGSGKTTTFKAILGLIQPDSGSVRVFGKDPRTFTSQEKERIGVVLSETGFQEYLTVDDVKKILVSMYRHFDEEVFEALCERLQLPRKKRIKEFSTGMKAKLNVLVAISHQADFLLLDEPTAGLDVVARQEVIDLLREYMETGERSILISSHISSDLEGFCDECYLIDQGEIVLREETDVLLSNYGVLKMTEEQYEQLDQQYILAQVKEPFGYRCLTSEKQYYIENAPEIVVEQGSIDEMIYIIVSQLRKRGN